MRRACYAAAASALTLLLVVSVYGFTKSADQPPIPKPDTRFILELDYIDVHLIRFPNGEQWTILTIKGRDAKSIFARFGQKQFEYPENKLLVVLDVDMNI
jgi:hypothetical protein